MKKKNSIRKPRRIGFFAMLAALLGITSGCKGGGEDVVCMYGVPTVSYELKGKVTDEAGNPVGGIEVSFEQVSPSDSTLAGNPFGPVATTDNGGQWAVSFQDFPTAVLKVLYTDVDGADHGGQFVQDSTVVRDIEPVKNTKNDNAFDLGEVKLEIPDAKLKKL